MFTKSGTWTTRPVCSVAGLRAPERMPVIDLTLLRMSTYELLAMPDIPTGVVISEAVDLAKLYSTEESGRFVNGVLASIAAEIRGPAEPRPD